jgi:hypothetical protein
MKKIITTVLACHTILLANAQTSDHFNQEVFNVCATIFVVLAIMFFILALLRRILEHRLKNKIVDKGIPENIVSSILQTSPHEEKNINVKWFALLAGLGAGLLLVYYTKPLDIHSLAIMAFSISLSFLGYYVFVNRAGNKPGK